MNRVSLNFYVIMRWVDIMLYINIQERATSDGFKVEDNFR